MRGQPKMGILLGCVSIDGHSIGMCIHNAVIVDTASDSDGKRTPVLCIVNHSSGLEKNTYYILCLNLTLWQGPISQTSHGSYITLASISVWAQKYISSRLD